MLGACPSGHGGTATGYVDTSAFIAFMGVSDAYHALFRRSFATPPSAVVTTSLVIADQDLTLADAVGLHLMRAYGAASCRSTDRHLGLAGTRFAIHAT